MSSFRIQGVGGAPGIATGAAWVLVNWETSVEERSISDEEIPGEILRLQDALLATRGQIAKIRERVSRELGEGDAGIFDAHLLLVDDHSFIEKVLTALNERHRNIETILREVVDEYLATFSHVDDDYLRGRAADLRDVMRRILQNLAGGRDVTLANMPEAAIVVARDLSPSETAGMDRKKVLGLATDLGSPVSHTVIVARSMGIPAVVALKDVSKRVASGEALLMDGTTGLVLVRPGKEDLAHYGALDRRRIEVRQRYLRASRQPTATREGSRIVVAANIESPDDCGAVAECGAEAVGLFRTEFLFLSRTEPPSEEEQAEAFAKVVRSLAPAPVVIRTLDVGGDKFPTANSAPHERNPFLGCRGIRYSLGMQRQAFRAQLRAILRASRHGTVSILYPMISIASELEEANELLAQLKAELRSAGEDFRDNIEIGAMVEVPAAALTLDLLAPHLSFVSLGTNDLVQYLFAADRTNERTAMLHQPAHPAVVRLIRDMVAQARSAGLPVSVCGEAAGSPLLTALLVGLGVGSLSMAPPAVPLVKGAVRGLVDAEASALAEEAARAPTAEHVLNLCRELLGQTNPDLLELLS